MSVEIQEFNNVRTHEQLPPHIVEGVAACISNAFGGNVTEEDALAHMAGDQVLVATDGRTGSVVGFTSTLIDSPQALFGDPILTDQVGTYFAGAAIAQEAQGSGLYHMMNDQRLNFGLRCGYETVFTRTQNPRVIEGVTSGFDRLVGTDRIAAYGLSLVVQQGAYGQMLTAEKPQGRKLSLDLDYDRGDAVVATWKFEK